MDWTTCTSSLSCQPSVNHPAGWLSLICQGREPIENGARNRRGATSPSFARMRKGKTDDEGRIVARYRMDRRRDIAPGIGGIAVKAGRQAELAALVMRRRICRHAGSPRRTACLRPALF
ncbi:hypothetical protein [Rhizobium ruizarguesonis]|jgi:hypothetical protein|uniref:hypothetical protein n=1 Tax=Rhizobium ruizarguesonis TaxID=2081791 RepID=UPI0010D268AC|nr:hypothetical protein [Rhizobium ruizarguesonis]TBE99664.1 hypothetical protein ELG98_25320 [Rhizobium ruizarguesonis]